MCVTSEPLLLRFAVVLLVAGTFSLGVRRTLAPGSPVWYRALAMPLCVGTAGCCCSSSGREHAGPRVQSSGSSGSRWSRLSPGAERGLGARVQRGWEWRDGPQSDFCWQVYFYGTSCLETSSTWTFLCFYCTLQNYPSVPVFSSEM